MSELIKAISLWQPWASLWLSPAKRHETRHWATPHRGRLLVHAAKRIERDVDPDLDEILVEQFGAGWRADLPTGALIGEIDLEACVPTETIAHSISADCIEEDDFYCGDFSPGRYGWRRGPTFIRFRDPVPYRGRQSLFSVPEAAIRAAMTAIVKFETAAEVEHDD